ncbi:MAG TPA: ATP-binding protein [Candidatus Acidoferrales bacterium]|nr:ATP-binding protein [Candidatus Acidoferrales bacterium]
MEPRSEYGAKQAFRDRVRVPLESIIITDELSRRPPRPPDHEAENRALVSLMQSMATSPGTILQQLVEVAMRLCKAHSSGVSLLAHNEQGEDVFRWNAIAGEFAGNLGGSIGRDVSPCGVVLKRGSILLFSHPERHYDYLFKVEPPIVEALLIPFHYVGKPVGTLWVIAHDESRKFDAEDARVLSSLGNLASSVYQVLMHTEEHRKAKEALQETESRFRSFMDNSPTIAWVKNERGEYIYVSKTFERRFGVRSEEWHGKADAELFSEEDARHFRENDLAVLETGRPIEVVEEATNPDGSKSLWLNTKFPIASANGERLVAGIGLDITERKRSEEALLQSEKLAATGRLAATIAHEVNNPLAAALNSVYLASTDPSQVPQMLALAEQELRRAAHITQQTLGFFRETGAQKPVSLPHVIDEVLAVYARKLQNRNVSVERRYRCTSCIQGACAGCFLMNAGEFRQIVSNLVANGIDALADGGVLRTHILRTSDPKTGRARIQLTIADNGCGIRTENLKRIFEPFFTTKKDIGTGLGLWVTQELVRKHNGLIKVRSTNGKGTIFQIIFPAMLEVTKQDPSSA